MARGAELRRREADAWERQGEYLRALAALDTVESEGQSLPASVHADIELSRGEVYHRQGNYDAADAAA